MTRIKICGLSRACDIDYVNEAMPDYIGFVFAGSRRQVSEALAGELKSRLRPEIQAVGVFVNEEPDKILRLCNHNIIDVVQLHGDEDEKYLSLLKEKLRKPVIRAARVKTSQDVIEAGRMNCEYLLLDAYREDQYGGSGEAFDWSLITGMDRPFFLAGGINAANAVKAVRQVRPYGVDVSSGVETDGLKDRNKIIELISKIRSVG